ncbi:MAG: hypothetical protein K2I19_08900, partial [Muribaculaceae bacterium]|nr:hypothetical protein [Muribaculaceae bacterium]
MRRTLTLTTILAASVLSLSAQSFTVFTKSGETVGFNNDNVERIEFSMTSLPDDPTPPVLDVINFNEFMESLSPAEGILDLKTTPQVTYSQ